MSLRAEIHDAFDEATPPALQLELRVRALLVDHARERNVVVRRGGRAKWTKPLHNAVTLVAAALVVLLIGGLIVGGRILHDLKSQPQTINQAELRQLESRDLQLPVVLPNSTCPISPLADVSAHSAEQSVFGVGPVYSTPLAGISATTDWGTWTALGLVVDTTTVSGPLLIRARDLETGEQVVFVRYPLHAIDDPGDGIPAGKVIGSQPVEGEMEQLYPELVIDTSRTWMGTKRGDWPIYKGFMGFPKGAQGCIGFRIDGANFTEVVVVST